MDFRFLILGIFILTAGYYWKKDYESLKLRRERFEDAIKAKYGEKIYKAFWQNRHGGKYDILRELLGKGVFHEPLSEERAKELFQDIEEYDGICRDETRTDRFKDYSFVAGFWIIVFAIAYPYL